MMAAAAGHIAVIERLLPVSNVAIANKGGLTAMAYAAMNDHVEAGRLLLPFVDINAASPTPLHVAVLYGSASFVSFLVQNGANVNLQADDGYTPLAVAMYDNNVDIAKCLLASKRCDLTIEDEFSANTPLMEAVTKRQTEMAKAIAVYADLTATNSRKFVPMDVVILTRQWDLFDDFLPLSPPNMRVGFFTQQPLVAAAAQYRNAAQVRGLIDRGADVNAASKNGRTALVEAAALGKVDVVHVVLGAGANVNVADTTTGETALMLAAAANSPLIVDLLLARGANPCAVDTEGRMAVHHAVLADNVAILELLLATTTLSDPSSLVGLATAHQKHRVVQRLLRDDPAAWQAAAPSDLFWQPKIQPYDFNTNQGRVFTSAYTIVELQYLAVLSAVLSKRAWSTKLADDDVRATWQVESGLNQEQFAYLEQELRVYQRLVEESAMCPGSAHGAFTTDALIGSSLIAELQARTASLEADAVRRGDYHPHSDDQVLDIVHPSLYCAIYNRTLFSQTPNAAYGDRILTWNPSNIPATVNAADNDVSTSYQWLPSPLMVDAAGRARFTSYVNNLPPSAPVLETIEAAFASLRPLFEAAVASKTTTPLVRIPHPGRFRVSRFKYASEQYTAQTGLSNYETDAFRAFHKDLFDDVDDNELPFITPVLPPRFTPPPVPVPVTPLSERELHVIVKIASINLTPEKPKYAGGAWHIEGMANEAIVATGLIYYDVRNISESRLRFRHVFDPTEALETEGYLDEGGLEAVYGVTNGVSENVQETGFITATTGRAVVFPNFLQHRVDPFELVDKTAPGQRKILAFFLVDPSRAVVSTAHVPPQQAMWASLASSTGLPTALAAEIDALQGTMTHAEARTHMEALMAERAASQLLARNNVYAVSLCEH
ncbi:hypothetical protein, variant [Saprolegnia diclina VS20]|nr:hypothetical protein, variant [Saprolegnia diclina VS20]EQC31492.1 hypothetical protein, variant [Saprolegnia diclina VS20]|eukprot:XP_008614891.1 hypothetical protein, variant [Saprolegnia diclina VS20]